MTSNTILHTCILVSVLVSFTFFSQSRGICEMRESSPIRKASPPLRLSVPTHNSEFDSYLRFDFVCPCLQLRHQAYFCFPDWTGGLYVTPTIAGSRPGALTAACWAAMVRRRKPGEIVRVGYKIHLADICGMMQINAPSPPSSRRGDRSSSFCFC